MGLKGRCLNNIKPPHGQCPSQRLFMRCSKNIVQRFQKQYKKSYGLDITMESADAELYHLMRLVEIVFLSMLNNGDDDYDGNQ